jgi:hypothetical protein
MAILKLTIGREYALTGTIEQMQEVEGKFGAQAQVDFTSGDTVYLPLDKAQQQVTRLGKDFASMQGEAVTIWKKPMRDDPTKGFLNIELGAKGAAVNVADIARRDDVVGRDLRAAGIAVKRVASLDEIVDRYAECLGRAHALVTDYNDTLAGEGKDLPSEIVTNVAATLLIARDKAGV